MSDQNMDEDRPMVTLRVGDIVRHGVHGDGVLAHIAIEPAPWAVLCDVNIKTHYVWLMDEPLEKIGWREDYTECEVPAVVVRVRPRLDSPLEEAFYDAMPPEMRDDVTTQHVVGKYRLDFAFVDEKLCVEVDGRSYHSNDEAFARDRSRDRWLMANGWRVIRFASDEVFTDAARCVAEVAAMRTTA